MTAPSKTIQKAKASVEKRAGTAGRWTRTNETRYHFTIFKAGGFLNG